MNPSSPSDNQQLINKLSSADNILQDIKKYRKKVYLQCAVMQSQMIDLSKKILQCSDQIYEHQLNAILGILNCSSVQASNLQEVNNFLKKLLKFFQPKYDLTQIQLTAIKIYRRLTRVHRDKKINQIENINKILRIIIISRNRSDYFEESLKLLNHMLQIPLNPEKKFTIVDIICKQKSFEILYNLIEGNSFYFKQIMSTVLLHFYVFLKTTKSMKQYEQMVSKQQDEYIFDQLAKFITRSCQILNQPFQIAQNYTTAIQFLSISNIFYLSLNKKQIRKLYANIQLQNIQIEINQKQKYISKILHQQKILDILLKKYHNDQLQYYQQDIIDILQLMIYQISIAQFKEKIIPLLQKILKDRNHSQPKLPAISLLIQFIHLKSQQQNSEASLFDAFCNSNLSQTIFDQIFLTYNQQCAKRYFQTQNFKQKFLLSNYFFSLVILGYQIVQKCNISLYTSDHKIQNVLDKAYKLFHQCLVQDIQTIDKLDQRLKSKRSSQYINRRYFM